MATPTRPFVSEPLHCALLPIGSDNVAKPNYQFEKRQRELKKIKQQEEKRLKKLAGAAADESADAAEPAAPETTQPEQTP